ncbi:MAG: hypothetical protein JKY13_03140, partial [Gammaproteobacteria bacterium]|nr:hypothetical protein [Gammaproteobacteria bacterium]
MSDSNLLLHLPLNGVNSSNQVVDLSGNDHHGTAMNSPSLGTDAIFGNTLDFNGSLQYVEVPHDASFNVTQLTLCAWINISTHSLWRGIITSG